MQTGRRRGVNRTLDRSRLVLGVARVLVCFLFFFPLLFGVRSSQNGFFFFGFFLILSSGIHFAESAVLIVMASILTHFRIEVASGDVRPEVEFTTGITR